MEKLNHRSTKNLTEEIEKLKETYKKMLPLLGPPSNNGYKALEKIEISIEKIERELRSRINP